MTAKIVLLSQKTLRFTNSLVVIAPRFIESVSSSPYCDDATAWTYEAPSVIVPWRRLLAVGLVFSIEREDVARAQCAESASRSDHAVDETVGNGLVGRHEVVAVDVV